MAAFMPCAYTECVFPSLFKPSLQRMPQPCWRSPQDSLMMELYFKTHHLQTQSGPAGFRDTHHSPNRDSQGDEAIRWQAPVTAGCQQLHRTAHRMTDSPCLFSLLLLLHAVPHGVGVQPLLDVLSVRKFTPDLSRYTCRAMVTVAIALSLSYINICLDIST